MTLHSMTGFASRTGSVGEMVWRWEMRSVNGRGLDLKLRLPSALAELEPKCREAAKARLARGSVSAQLEFAPAAAGRGAVLDRARLAALIDAVSAAREALAERDIAVAPLQAEALALAPGVLASGADASEAADEAAAAAILAGFGETVATLQASRNEEGVHIGRSISAHLDRIESLVRDAEGCADAAVEALRARLREQLAALLSGENAVSPERLEQEIAVLATKADVREELDRLAAHCAAARDLLAGGSPAGRKLDFLTQEFNREANTLCSKAATDAMTRIGLELKSVIDQLREQAANVE